MQAQAKTWLKAGGGALISLALVYWLIVSMEWSEVWRVLQSAHYGVLFPITLLTIIHFVVRGVRWHFLLPEGRDSTLRARVDAILMGAFATYILPLRAGEIVRPLLLARTSAVPFSVGFASVVLERFFDLSAVLLTFGGFILMYEGFPRWAYNGALSLSILAGVILCGLVATAVIPVAIRRLVAFLVKPLPSAVGAALLSFFDGISAGASVLRDPRRIVAIVCLTGLIWASAYLITYGYLLLFPVEPSIKIAIGTSVVLALAVAAPSAPGFIGVYQTAWIAAFLMFGLPQELALGYAILSHVHQYLMFTLYGGWYLLARGMRLGELCAVPSPRS